MWSWKCELFVILHRGWTVACNYRFLDEILRHATFQYSVHNAASLEGTLCKNLDQGYIKINGPVKGKFLLGSLFQVSFPPQFERFPLFLFLNFSFTFLPILNSTTSSIASFATNLHFADTPSASPRLYPNSQTNLNQAKNSVQKKWKSLKKFRVMNFWGSGWRARPSSLIS